MNKELNRYFKLLCNDDYPEFIDKYINTFEMQLLNGRGQFCGCDYNNIFNIRFWYSRLHHSIAVSLITWNLTKDKKQTLAALFHDMGTPVFSHCVDFMLGDAINQESGEISVKDIILNSTEITDLLQKDRVDVQSVIDCSNYSIVENKSPKLCADRLEGVMHTPYIWLGKNKLTDIKKYYLDITTLINEENEPEIGFNSKESAELFFNDIYVYSMALQSNEDSGTLSFIGDALKYLINNNLLNKNDLYKLNESDIIPLFAKYFPNWNKFAKATKLIKSDCYFEGAYEKVPCKKRFVNPLCAVDGQNFRLTDVSDNAKVLVKKYKEFNDFKYYDFTN